MNQDNLQLPCIFFIVAYPVCNMACLVKKTLKTLLFDVEFIQLNDSSQNVCSLYEYRTGNLQNKYHINVLTHSLLSVVC